MPGNFIKHTKNLLLIGLLIIIFAGLLINTDQITISDNSDLGSVNVLGEHILPNITPDIVPYTKDSTDIPLISAEAAIVIDQDSFSPLFSKNGEIPTYPASTTKIATAIVVLEEYDLQKTLSVPSNIYNVIDGSKMGLLPNDVLTVNDLLTGMLINSGNDAAYVLALNYPDGYDAFIGKMNQVAQKLHLSETSFDNPIGYDSDNNYISPHDLAILANYAYSFPLFQKIVNTVDTIVFSHINPNYRYILHNTNNLLGKLQGVNGIKTGWTATAQGVLVTHVERDYHKIIVVVMRSSQRELDTQLLIQWVYHTYEW